MNEESCFVKYYEQSKKVQKNECRGWCYNFVACQCKSQEKMEK